MVNSTSRTPAGGARKPAQKVATPPATGKPVLLAGGNPQIPKDDGDAPVQA